MSILESLQTLENVMLPDSRRKHITLDYLHSELSKIELSKSVPEEITIQFETAKNLFLYSWFVYRFHHIADLQAIAALELALKTKFDELKIEYRPEAGLWKHLITIEDIPGYFELAKHKARQRHLKKNLRKVIEENLEELKFDESAVLPEEVDFDPNYLNDAFTNLRELRNEYAHGTTALLTPNFGILNLTKSLINAIYKLR